MVLTREYLKGGYISGYRDAPDEGGYYAPGQGVTLLKIDNQAFANKDLASKATVYAVANVDPVIFGRDGDGDGRPDGITKLSDLKNLVYAPESVSLGLPSGGMPMVGSKVIDLTKTETSSDDERRIDLTALMARIDVDIQLDSEVEENNLPALYSCRMDSQKYFYESTFFYSCGKYRNRGRLGRWLDKEYNDIDATYDF